MTPSKRFPFIIGLILFTFLLAPSRLPGQKEDDLDKALKRLNSASASFATGLKDFNAGRLDKAEEDFRSCLGKFPEHAYAHYYLANIFFLHRNFPASLSQMESAMAQLDLMNALAERADKRKIEKLDSLQDSLDAMWDAADRTSAPCRNKRSIEWDKKLAENEAFQAEKAAAEKKAAFTRMKAHYTYFLGNIHFRLQNIPEAFRCYEEAIRIDPRHADATNNLVAICYVARQYPVAQAFLQKAEEQGLDESLNLELKERLYKALGRSTEGILQEDVLAKDPDRLGVRRFALAYQPEPVGSPKLYVNAYVVYNPASRTALLIDPGVEDSRIGAFIQDKNLKVMAVLNTHGHRDHRGANAFFAKQLQAPVFVPKNDAREYDTPPGRLLQDGEVLELEGLTIRILHTPGHSEGSLCFQIGDILFSGDTLFRGDVGRIGIENGKKRNEVLAAMVKTIREKLLVLPEDTIVCPGHGKTTTIGAEKANNPLLAKSTFFPAASAR